MRRSTVAPFVVALALFAGSGCGDAQSASPENPAKTEPVKKAPDPPGLSPGVIQIFKISGGPPAPIGYVVSHSGSELWVLMQNVSYPVMLQQNESLRFDHKGPVGSMDADGLNGVSKAEFTASQYGGAWVAAGTAVRVTEMWEPAQ